MSDEVFAQRIRSQMRLQEDIGFQDWSFILPVTGVIVAALLILIAYLPDDTLDRAKTQLIHRVYHYYPGKTLPADPDIERLIAEEMNLI